MVKREVYAIIVIFFVIISSYVSAEAWFASQPLQVYSYGDNLDFRVSMSETGKQLVSSIYCGNESKTIFLQYITSNNSVNIVQPLTKDFLGELIGKCGLILNYGDDYERSQEFLISDSVFLNLETTSRYFAPGENLIIKGKADKANGKPLNGFYEMSFDSLNISRAGIIENGIFEINFSLPEDIKAGDYLVNVSAYDKIENEISNNGFSTLSFGIKQVPKELGIALESQNVHPGKNLSFKIMLYDQSGEKIEGDASYSIKDSQENTIRESLSGIDKSEYFFPEKNITSGYYKISAYSSGISSDREFFVEENEEAEFNIVNRTLIIKNVGNVIYDKAIQVKIGGVVQLINDPLGIGEEKKYEMIAPKGEYEIAVTDGASSFEKGGIMLTGKAIALREIEKGFFSRSKFTAWVFIILVLGIFVFVYSRKTLRKKFILNDRIFKSDKKEKGIMKASQLPKQVVKRDAKIAEHSLVLDGNKQDNAIICVKVKNKLDGMAKLNFDNILSIVHEKKATIYRTGDYFIEIFSPSMTSTFRNHVPAVKMALEIQKKIEEHNQKYKDKIDYGISVHNGELVSKIEDDKLKFTSVGNTIVVAKKLADISEKEVLLSRSIHEKTISEVKAEPVNKGGSEIFRVKNILDREQNEVYIQEFLKRQEEEK